LAELRQVRATSERALRLAAAFVLSIICAFAPARSAGAIGPPTSFDMSPSSGPARTTVNVSGTGCSPGLLPQSTFVAVEAATVPATSVRLKVHRDGSWSGSFTIPDNAPAAPAAVSASCVSGGLQSLLTVYTPRTFTVTGNGAPTTLASPLPPPTTMPADPGNATDPNSPNPGTSSSVSVPHDPIDAGASGARGGRGDGTAADRRGSAVTAATVSRTDGTKSGPGTRAAELSSPELSVSRSGDGSGLGWLLWVLALAVPVGGSALYLWMRRARRPDDLDPEGDPA
jgi:hypothetical protein